MKNSGQTYADGKRESVKHSRQTHAESGGSVRDYRDERLPQIVEDRLQEAYEQIRRGEIKQMKGQKDSYRADSYAESRDRENKAERHRKKRRSGTRRWMSAAAVLALVILIPSAVYAAVVYFQKTDHLEKDALTYEFALNYEITPGEYQVKADYIPKGFADDEDGDGKYYGENEEWITIMPIYTTAELDKINGQITVEKIDRVDHTELSGMPADVITFQDAEKNRSNTYIFLFNEEEGYVLNIVAGYGMDRQELLEFADSLKVERTGDGHYETEEEKALREKQEQDESAAMQEGEKVWDTLMRLGIPEEKMIPVGGELFNYDGSCSYTVTDYEFLSSIEGFAEGDFFDYTRFDGWLNPDKTLRPYTRRHLDENGEVIEEEKAEQEILRVSVKAHCYDDTDPDIPLGFALQYVTKTENDSVTWAENIYEAVPAEEYYLQMDDSAVYFDKAVHVNGGERNHFFYREMKAGEDLEYTLLFVVDKDRKDDFLLYPDGSNYDLWQTESMTAEEIRSSLQGYIRLKPITPPQAVGH